MPLSTGGSDSGEKLRAWYDIAEQHFTILSDSVQIFPDTAVNTFGLAWYRGLDTKGTTDPSDDEPRFQVRDDIDVDQLPYIPFHEAGHAFQEIVARAIARNRNTDWLAVFDEIRTRYWTFRGFPGVWMDGQLRAINGGGWSYYPDESFADAFAHVMLLLHPVPGYVTGEWTWNYDTPPIWTKTEQALRFMQDLANEAQGEDMTPAQEAKLDRVLALLEARESLVWEARAQRFLDVETGKPYDPNKPTIDTRIRQ